MSEEKRSWPTYLAIAGAVVGLAGGLLLGGLRVANSEAPQLRAEWAGNVMFTLVYLVPFVLSLIVLRWRRPLWRAAVWAAAGALAAGGIYTAFSGVTLVLLPAALLLIPAAAATLIQVPPRRLLATILLAIALVALVAGAFMRLILGPGDGRCWELVRGPQGETAWQVAPYSQSGTVTASAEGDEPGVLRVLCTSDVITTAEAGQSFLLLLLAGLLVMWLPPRWPEAGHHESLISSTIGDDGA